MGGRALSVVVISANAAGGVYYLFQGRTGLTILLAAVAVLVAWAAFRSPSAATTFRPVRTLTAAAAFFGAVTVLMLVSLAGAGTEDSTALGAVGAGVAAVLTGVMPWALLRARRMGFGWSTELDRRQRPEDNPSAD